MQRFQCEVCGGNEITKRDGLFVCEHCGMKYTQEEAKKILGTVKVDKSEDIEKLYQLARRARDENNYDDGEKYYGMILLQEPNSWEAILYHGYFKALELPKYGKHLHGGTIPKASKRISELSQIVVNTIEQIDDQTRRVTSLTSFLKAILSIGNDMISSDFKRVESIYKKCLIGIADMLYLAAEAVNNSKIIDLTSVGKEQADLYELAISALYEDRDVESENYARISKAASRIRRFNPKYELPESKPKEACYIATCVYGSYECPQVRILRKYRDRELMMTGYGRCFVKLYYALSPTAVKLFGKKRWFQLLGKTVLDRIVNKIRSGIQI